MKIVLDACFDLAQGGYNTDNESCTNFAAAYRSAAMYFEKMTGADITIVDGSYNHDMADQTKTDIGDDEDTFETIVWQAIHNCLTVDHDGVWSWEKDAADKQISRIDWSAVECKSINKAARQMGRKGGAAKSAAKKSASRENGKRGGRPTANQFSHAVVVEYDCGLGERGTTVSKHKTYELARASARRSGFDSFLAIRPIE